MSNRFTIDGSDALESKLANLCAQVREAVLQIIPARRMVALLLGGGYGRGEGGVLRTVSGDEPYNDLEFYILLGSEKSGTFHGASSLFNFFAERRFDTALHPLAERLTHLAGIEVEFKILPIGKLQRSPVTMFYYDLITGHRVLHGSDSWLAGCDQHRAAHRIPMHEASRLLMNRCSGLLYSQVKLSQAIFTAADADFVGRNLAKAKLAFGDVLLAMRGQYHWSSRERQKRLRKLDSDGALSSFTSVVPLHAQGVEFKLHPFRSDRSASELQSELAFHKEIAGQLWLQLESRRLGQSFASLIDYSSDPSNKCPETNPHRNRLINIRRFGLRDLHSRYPRERLLRTLPILLWESDSLRNPKSLAFLQNQLRTNETEPTGLVRAYESIWKNFN